MPHSGTKAREVLETIRKMRYVVEVHDLTFNERRHRLGESDREDEYDMSVEVVLDRNDVFVALGVGRVMRTHLEKLYRKVHDLRIDLMITPPQDGRVKLRFLAHVG